MASSRLLKYRLTRPSSPVSSTAKEPSSLDEGGGRVELLKLSLVDEGDSAAEGLRFLDVVGRQDNGPLLSVHLFSRFHI